VGYIALASLDVDLVNLAVSCQCEQASSSDVCVSPMCQAQFDIVLRLQLQCEASPRKQCLSLADDPVVPSVQIYRDNARYGVFCGDEGRDGAGRRYFLVEERDADGGALKRLEDGQGRQRVFRLAAEADQGSAAGVERLGGGEGDGEEGKGRADDVEAGVCAGNVLAASPRGHRGKHTGRVHGRGGALNTDGLLQRRIWGRAGGRDVDASRRNGRGRRAGQTSPGRGSRS
jgi:hypothetical protein